jgi:hypothetical protein
MDAAINKVISLLYTQLQESAARGSDGGQIGKLDFQLAKDIVKQSHASAKSWVMKQ